MTTISIRAIVQFGSAKYDTSFGWIVEFKTKARSYIIYKILVFSCMYFVFGIGFIGAIESNIIGQHYYLKYHVLSLGCNLTTVYPEKVKYIEDCIDSENLGLFYDQIGSLIFRGQRVTISEYNDDGASVHISFDFKGNTTTVLLLNDVDKAFSTLFSKEPVTYDYQKVVTLEFYDNNIKTEVDLIYWFGFPVSMMNSQKV